MITEHDKITEDYQHKCQYKVPTCWKEETIREHASILSTLEYDPQQTLSLSSIAGKVVVPLPWSSYCLTMSFGKFYFF